MIRIKPQDLKAQEFVYNHYFCDLKMVLSLKFFKTRTRNRLGLGVFKGDNMTFEVVPTILETLDMEPHGNDKKKGSDL